MALARSCRSFAEQLDGAEVVFSGRAIGHDLPESGVVGRADPVVWTFAGDTVYRGPVEPELSVLSARDSASCGAEFEAGGSHLSCARAPQAAGWAPDSVPVPSTALTDPELRLLGPGRPPAPVEEPVAVRGEPLAGPGYWLPWTLGGLGRPPSVACSSASADRVETPPDAVSPGSPGQAERHG